MTSTPYGHLARLPVQILLRLGKGTDSFIRRLAHANHLKPSYLHGFLCGLPQWFGKPRVERLADVCGRNVADLNRVLSDASTPRRRYRPGPGKSHLASRRPDLYLKLHDAARDESLALRQLANCYRVPRRLVRDALAGNRPPEHATALSRDLPAQQVPVTRTATLLINSMLAAGLSTRDIWAALMDEHDTSISYTTLNLHVSRHRRHLGWQEEQFRQR